MTQPGTAVEPRLDVHRNTRVENRWWIYQKERFPLATHAPGIIAFSFAAIGYSNLASDSGIPPGWREVLVAFATSFLFFFQLRLADEFKDFEEDSRYRPYRPVPRGLIQLRELTFVWAGCLALQLALATWLSSRLIPPLITVWSYLLLMSKEFFVRNWLKRHAITYMLSHMLIMPLIFLFASACDWMVAGYSRPPRGLVWMAAANFFNGVVIEIGRKIRAPDDEEQGVETYSFLWGRRNAVLVWLGAMAATAVVAFAAGRIIHFTQVVTSLLLAVLLTSVVAGIAFLLQSKSGRAKWIGALSAVWTLAMYLSLGVVPVLLRYYRGQK
jgi:hypothetical protein